MTDAAKRVLLFSVIAGVGLVIAIVAISKTSPSPRAFIQDTYSCDVDPTESDSASCEANNSSAAAVAGAIATNTRPIDQNTNDGIEFLQYEDDIVAVRGNSSGAKVTVDDYETGYRNYSTYFVGFGWTSYRPSGGGFGGGGYGGGYGGGGK